jgi:hypothetical protein
MTADKKDEDIEWILMKRDAAAVTLMNDLESFKATVIECKISKEDFVWSSR